MRREADCDEEELSTLGSTWYLLYLRFGGLTFGSALVDQIVQISPSTIINFYLAMLPPPNTRQQEAESALVPKD